MTIKGVSNEQLKVIKNVLLPYLSTYDFFMYGSRVKGNFSKNSDLDILVKGQTKISSDMMEKIQKELDESNLPFIVHFADFHDLNFDFYESLNADLVKI